MSLPLNTERIRTLHSTYSALGADFAENYVRSGDCTKPLNWTAYYSNPNLSHLCGRRQYMRDVVVPGFSLRRSKGEVFFNPMTKYICEVGIGSGTHFGEVKNNSTTCPAPYTYNPLYRFRRTGQTFYGRQLSGLGFPTELNGWPVYSVSQLFTDSDQLSLRQEATTACLSNRGRVSYSNLYETIAQFDLTMSLASNIFDTLRKVINAHKAEIVASGVAGGWLIWRYGVNPLASDIRNVVEALEKFGGKRRISSRGFAAQTKTGSRTKTDSIYATWTAKGRISITETYECRAMSLDEVLVSFLDDAGLGLKGLLTLPWELITLSFVLDWFLNFGDLLGAIAPAANASQLGACMVTKRTTREFYTLESAVVTNPATFTVTKYPDIATHERVQTLTTRTLGLENPALVIRGDFGLHKWRRALDSVALLTQALVSLHR